MMGVSKGRVSEFYLWHDLWGLIGGIVILIYGIPNGSAGLFNQEYRPAIPRKVFKYHQVNKAYEQVKAACQRQRY